MAIQAWFPTYIYYEALQRGGAARFNAELLRECYQIRDFDRAGRKWSEKNYPGGFTSYGSLTKLHKMSSTFGELERKLTRHVRRFVRHLELNLRGYRLELTDCWVNIMPHRTTHSLHLHPLSLISGSYYVSTPPNCAGLKFEDPRLSRFMAAPPRVPNCRPENRQHVTYDAKAGHVILFESWLRHEVPPTPSDEDRVSLSFNYNWF
ncbi:2OG-Fe(II) oxygenase-related protein [Verrucomicrobiota bacterium]|nr:2OG-Fe(II) oxygenase-related protein [Verrucomicrobiota bacterium]